MISLMRRTEEEITGSNETIAGNVFIGTGETETVRYLHRLLKNCSKNIQIFGIISPAVMRNMFLNIWIRVSSILDCFLQRLIHRI